MSKKGYRVVPRSGQWAVLREGAARATSVHSTQTQALEAGRQLARHNKTELVIHGRDGRLRDTEYYGNYPKPPRGVQTKLNIDSLQREKALPYVECEVGPGLRESEVQVTIHDAEDRKERLRVEAGFVRRENGACYLPVGIVARHPDGERVLIEFPHEADSGANRIWVHREALLQEAGVA